MRAMARKIYILLLILSFLGMWGIFLRYTSGGVDTGYLLTTILFSLLPLIFAGILLFKGQLLSKFPGLVFFASRKEMEGDKWEAIASKFFDLLGLTGTLISVYLLVVENTAFDYIQRRDIPNPEYFITFAVIAPMLIFGLFLFMLYKLAAEMDRK